MLRSSSLDRSGLDSTTDRMGRWTVFGCCRWFIAVFFVVERAANCPLDLDG